MCGTTVELLITTEDNDKELVSLMIIVELLITRVGKTLVAIGVGVAAAARLALCLEF